MGKAIDLRFKVTVEPYIGQTCNFVSWIRYDFALPISTRANIITPLGKLSGHTKHSCFKSKKVVKFNNSKK